MAISRQREFLADAGSDMRPTDLREVAAIRAELLAPDHPAAGGP